MLPSLHRVTGSAYVALLASPDGSNVYPKFGFSFVDAITVSVFSAKIDAHHDLARGANNDSITLSSNHAHALQFYNSIRKKDYSRPLNSLYQSQNLCAVAYTSNGDGHFSNIVAAAWAHTYDMISTSTDVHSHNIGLFIGPVVAHNSAYAQCVIVQLVRQFVSRFRHRDRDHQCARNEFEVSVLAVQPNSSFPLDEPTHFDFFTRLGFQANTALQYMLLSQPSGDKQISCASGGHLHVDSPSLDLTATDLERYFGLLSYELG